MDRIAFLFDLDGVILDTERQYENFWRGIGTELISDPDMVSKVRGESTETTLTRYFPDEGLRQSVRQRLHDFEVNMVYGYIPGAFELLTELKGLGMPTAIVTSSNKLKMENVFRSRPELQSLVDRVLTPEIFGKSKPAPDCFLMGMKVCGTGPENSIVFEDSLNGLKSGRAAGCIVVGLTTTNPKEVVAQYSDMVIPDFSGVRAEDFAMLVRK